MMRASGGLSFSCGFLVVSGCLLFVCGTVHSEDDEWIDPYDMLNYDPTTKSMRKPAEAPSYNNVPSKGRVYSQDACELAQCPDMKQCTDKVNTLQREIEEHRRRATFSSQQPTCYPVFKRFLAKLLKEIEKLGLPSAVTSEMRYDAEVKLSKQTVGEIQKIVNDDSSWKTGALDDALSQILINFKLHDHEAWKWRFEDTFGVELDTVIKVTVMVLIIVAIICTEMWSSVSWFVQFKRMFAISFFISLVWNWFYLYKIAFAEHQANILKMEKVNDKCTGVKKLDWIDSYKEWFRTTWTLQDDPCKRYYEHLIVNPLLLVPPTKAITMTITNFITDPLKHIGQGISEFLRALLKDLPLTLQIPVLILIVLSILVFMYGVGQAAVQHAVLGPLRGRRRDPPPGIAQQPAAPPIQEQEGHREERELLAEGHASHATQPRHRVGQQGHQVNRRDNRAAIHQRRSERPDREQLRVFVETLRIAERLYSGDETDVAEDLTQHAGEEHLSNVLKEDNKTSASSPEMKQTHPAHEEHDAKSDSKYNEASGNTERREVQGSSSLRDASEKDCVENIGTYPMRGHDYHREEERELLARGDANHAAQPRHRVGQEGQTDREQRGVFVETRGNADRHHSGDETDALQQAVAEDLTQHAGEEHLSNVLKEDNKSSASSPEMKQTHPAHEEHDAKSDSKYNEASGNTERREVKGSSSLRDASEKDCVENVGASV